MKNDRFLTGIVVGIGLLVVVALVLFFTRQRSIDYLEGESPESVVHNYILAIIRRDYERAYSSLAEIPARVGLPQFRQDMMSNMDEINRTGVSVGEGWISGDTAFVPLNLSRSYGGVLAEMNRWTDRVQLKREAGVWKITQAPFPFWSWNSPSEPLQPYPEPGGKP